MQYRTETFFYKNKCTIFINYIFINSIKILIILDYKLNINT